MRKLHWLPVQPGFSCSSRLELNLTTHKSLIVPRELEGSQKNYISSLHRTLQAWFCEHSCPALQPGSCKTVLSSSGELNLVSSSHLVGLVSTVEISNSSSLLASTTVSSLTHREIYSERLAFQTLRKEASFKRPKPCLHHRSPTPLKWMGSTAERMERPWAPRMLQKPAMSTWPFDTTNFSLGWTGPVGSTGSFDFVMLVSFASPTHMTPDAIRLLQCCFSAKGSNLVLEIPTLSSEVKVPLIWLYLLMRVTPSGRLMFSAHITPTNLGHYIAADSDHISSTLNSWATTDLQRYARNLYVLAGCNWAGGATPHSPCGEAVQQESTGHDCRDVAEVAPEGFFASSCSTRMPQRYCFGAAFSQVLATSWCLWLTALARARA